MLWGRIPAALRGSLVFTDSWDAYAKVVPVDQHVACGKGSGRTNHIERWNNTLLQRLGRFVRKTLSFSKSDAMHERCPVLSLHHYNTRMARGAPAKQQP